MNQKLLTKLKQVKDKSNFILSTINSLEELQDFADNMEGETIYLGYDHSLNEWNRCEFPPEYTDAFKKLIMQEIARLESVIEKELNSIQIISE